MKRVLCVCMGNMARSPLMMVFAQQALAERGVDAIVESCGILDELLPGHGLFPGVNLFTNANRHSIAIARESGLDLDSHTPRHVSKFDLSSYDRIIVVDHHVRRALINEGAPVDRMVILNGENDGIPDPIGEGHKAYSACASIIKQTLPKALEGL
ncbi:MAG: hypothetical protein Q8Q10_04215 [bacterium]|nr:hypothetical protein [bacterium]